MQKRMPLDVAKSIKFSILIDLTTLRRPAIIEASDPVPSNEELMSPT